jgi:riboflavin kinase/FMN adenylyltransferase
MNTLPMIMKGIPTQTGSARGRRMDIPTINFDPSYAKDLMHGVYACWVTVDGKKYMGAMHFGPRPVFKDSVSFEVHLLDAVLTELPKTTDLEVVQKIREVEDFPDAEALKQRIKRDIEETRAILKAQ